MSAQQPGPGGYGYNQGPPPPQQGAPGYYQAPPGGGAPPGPGQAPQQNYNNYSYNQQFPPQAQPGQYPPPGQQGHYPPQGQYPPQGYYPPPGQQGQFPPPQSQPGQHPPQAPQGQYHAQGAYAQPLFPGQTHQQGYPPQQYQGSYPQAAPVPATPASNGYDPAQKQWVAHVDTDADTEALKKAMKGFGCDEKALIRVFTNAKYSNPWEMAQLVQDYNKRHVADLVKSIEKETRGDLETALVALLRGPLEGEAFLLNKALDRAGTDEEALVDVLIGRSNADLRAISAEYKRVFRTDLLATIKDDVGDEMFRFWSMVLAANKPEDAAPVIDADIDRKVTDLQRSLRGNFLGDAGEASAVFTSCNASQIHALVGAYQRKYACSLRESVEKAFRGDMEDVLLSVLEHATDRAAWDASRLRGPMTKTIRKDKVLIHRTLMLYWDRPRLDAAKAAYKKAYGTTLRQDLKAYLKGDYEDLMLALVGEK